MKILKLTFTLLLSLIYFVATAQDYSFMILGKKGDVTFDGKKVFVGSKLKLKGNLELKENSYLGLVHNSGRTIELKNSGKFSISDLTKKIDTKQKSVTDKYAALLLSELTGSKSNVNSKKAKYGSVSRGIGEVHPLAGKRTRVLSDVVLRWEAKENSYDAYKVIFRSTKRKVLLEKEVSANSLTINLDEVGLGKERNVLYEIVPLGVDGVKPETFMLTRLSSKEHEQLEEELSVIEGQDGEMALLLQAQMYEEHGLLCNATESYVKAVSEGGEIAEQLYKNYRGRLGLEK
ncbi:hypothetical protein [Sediminitomix flava]|uniref:DUF4369 domain-containing protein n=1 Tax=Sediminitomix flava TaxID=379075 RepID=A0A315ZH18_SEDFL|nr:hypothetical protein [Sediminitomix flava]PWJ44801.1 hypothetical protein BC781_1011179 [Sediminitomix flava]